jgi:hypothetical protein
VGSAADEPHRAERDNALEYNGKIEAHNSLLNVILFDKPDVQTRDVNK